VGKMGKKKLKNALNLFIPQIFFRKCKFKIINSKKENWQVFAKFSKCILVTKIHGAFFQLKR
jgi:hypothetical protein